MRSDRQRFLAALGLYLLWVAGLTIMAATSAARPVNLQSQAADVSREPAHSHNDKEPQPKIAP